MPIQQNNIAFALLFYLAVRPVILAGEHVVQETAATAHPLTVEAMQADYPVKAGDPHSPEAVS